MNNSFSYASLVKLADMKYRVMKTCLKSIYKSTFMVNRKAFFRQKFSLHPEMQVFGLLHEH